MQDLTLTLDHKMTQSLHELMSHYGVKSKAEIIAKAIVVLKTIAYVNNEDGEIVARKGDKETLIIVR